jgi:hypothetical protein
MGTLAQPTIVSAINEIKANFRSKAFPLIGIIEPKIMAVIEKIEFVPSSCGEPYEIARFQTSMQTA